MEVRASTASGGSFSTRTGLPSITRAAASESAFSPSSPPIWPRRSRPPAPLDRARPLYNPSAQKPTPAGTDPDPDRHCAGSRRGRRGTKSQNKELHLMPEAGLKELLEAGVHFG